MKASSLWVGEFYAWSTSPAKGKFTLGGRKVVLRGTKTRKDRFSTNAKTFAQITVVETGRELEVPARQILAFWDEYERELDARQREKKEAEQKLNRERVKNAMISVILSERLKEVTGMELLGRIKYSPYANTVTLPVDSLLKWLEVSDEDIEKAVTDHINGEGV